jgi:hypothetical protein
MGIVGGGAYAELSRIDYRMAMHVPKGLDLVDAGAVPEVFVTAHEALFHLAGLQAGESVLIHAAAGGVGSAAVQLAHAAGARVFATASGDKRDAVLGFGADVCIDYRSEDFAAVVAQATDGKGVDVVIDFVGAPYLEANVRSLAVGGRMVCVGLLGAFLLVITGQTRRTQALVEQRTLELAALAHQLEKMSADAGLASNLATVVTPDGLRVMLHDTDRQGMFMRGSALLEGARGRVPADTEALVSALVAISEFGATSDLPKLADQMAAALYQRFGDVEILRTQYASMVAWVDNVAASMDDDGVWRKGMQLGDWLDPAAPPDKPASARTQNQR